jgi:hypothetical protein
MRLDMNVQFRVIERLDLWWLQMRISELEWLYLVNYLEEPNNATIERDKSIAMASIGSVLEFLKHDAPEFNLNLIGE